MRARTALPLLLVAVLLLGACELRTELNIDVDDDGSGTVEFAVGVDDDVLDRRPDLLDELALDELAADGWAVRPPEREADDLTWVRVTKPFDDPDALGRIVDEIAGANGPFRDFTLEREDGLTATDLTFAGVVDFAAGAGGLVDDDLADEIDDEALDEVEGRVGDAVDQLVRVSVAVRLPGDVTSNAPTQASNGAVWRPSILEDEPVALAAAGTVSHTGRVVAIGLGVAAIGALVLFAAVRVAGRRRRRLAGDG